MESNGQTAGAVREFVAKSPDYRTGEVTEIWAEDPQSIAVLERVKQLVALINSFKGDITCNITDVILGPDAYNGHVSVCSYIRAESWRHFVELQFKKEL